MKKDYYQLLEISQSASVDEIKKSYRKLALKYHPDRNQPGDVRAELLFKQIVEAYHVLSRPDARNEYDHYLQKKLQVAQVQSRSASQFAETATATAKKAEVVTAATLLKQFTSIRRHLSHVDDHSRIKQEALYKQLSTLLSMKNIQILRTADRAFIKQVVETILDSCNTLKHSYVESLTPRLIKLAGSDNDTITSIHQYNKKHLRKTTWKQRKPFIILGFVGAAILTYIIFAFIFTSQK